MLNAANSQVACTYCDQSNSVFNPVCKKCGKDLPLLSLASSEGRKSTQAGQPWQSRSEAPSLPQDMGRYGLIRCLRSTPMSQVYQAEDRLMRRHVAIKAHLQGGDSEDFQTDFLKEARALAALNHPAIAQVYDCLQHGTFSCLVMEWVDGEPLGTKHFKTQAGFGRLLEQIFEALTLAHSRGLIHRDLKPDHLLVTSDFQLKMIDFGLVKRFGTAKDSLPSTPGHAFWRGTPRYMSPEQIAGEPLDWRSDMFSLAITLSECLFGHHPFGSDHAAIVLHQISRGDPHFPEGLQPWVGKETAAVLSKALAKEPAERWSTLDGFRQKLCLASGLPIKG